MESQSNLTFHILDEKIRLRHHALYGGCKIGHEWQTLSWADFRTSYLKVGVLLKRLCPALNPVVGILASPGIEWNLCDLATLAIGGIVVGFYSDDRNEVLQHIMEAAQPNVLIVMNEELLKRVQILAPEWGSSRPVIVIEHFSTQSDMLYSLRQWLSREVEAVELAAIETDIASLKEEQPASYIFTSGTSSLPKGAILTHSNLFNSATVYSRYFPLSETDTSLAYLPFSHIFARVMYYASLLCGVRIYYSQQSEEIINNIQVINPTVLLVVPRLLDKLRAKIQDKAASDGALGRWLFFWATEVGGRYYVRGHRGPLLKLQLSVARRLVLRKVTRLLGRRLRFLGCGGGHLPAHVTEFFQQFGIFIYEGYATTESGGLGVFNYPGVARAGTVGRATPEVQVALEPDGEICLRSGSLFAGYINDAPAAKNLRDGWLLTGDIGHLDSDGFLVIKDRKTDLFVTAYGKNVAPAWIEQQLTRSGLIEDAVVIGDGRPYLVALIVPQGSLLSRHGSDTTSTLLYETMQMEVYRINSSLSRYEQVRRFLIVNAFESRPGTVTATLKKRRTVIQDLYRGQIEAMYGILENSVSR
jgi:long-chain acyl-CoA synthetase